MKVLLTIIGLLFLSNIHAQTVHGSILDESDMPLTGATIVAMSPLDSSMLSFAISDDGGHFTLEDYEEDSIIIQVSFIGYQTKYKDYNSGQENDQNNRWSIQLTPSTELLQEVEVTAEHIPMGLLGDTISYNAAAFKTRPGASVEDLLKKLPGVEVQRDGSIKAMGENVENVLVDGKEFFGDDPQMATKNLEAEAVDKVEVFDKKSEIAEFTGVDDGEEEKTINLKLKEEYKKGGFGRIEAGGALTQEYEAKINYNRFSPKLQASLILGTNNINQQAFSFNDYIQFMGGIGNAFGSNMFSFNEMGQGNSQPEGITDDRSLGLNFNYDFSEKVKLKSHYFFMNQENNIKRQLRSEQFTESIAFTSLDSSNLNNKNFNHQAVAKLESKVTPFTQVIINTTLSSRQNENIANGQTLFQQDNSLISATMQDWALTNSRVSYEGKLQLRNKFKKKGRSWLNSISYQKGNFNEDQRVQNLLLFESLSERLDQEQINDYNFLQLSGSSNYSEPLGKQFYLSLRYSYQRTQENPFKQFFNILDSNKTLDAESSGAYEKTDQINRYGFSIKKNHKDYKFSFGLAGQSTLIQGSLSQDNITPIENLKSTNFNLLPLSSIEYDISKSSSINLNYYTRIQRPSLAQLAPLPDNSNPNSLRLGNPDLNPEYHHSIRLGYNLIDRFNFKNFFMNLTYSAIKGRIINEIMIDDNFIRLIRPFNSNGYQQITSYASYGAPIKPLKLKFNTSLTYYLADYTTSLNGLSSNVKESNYNLKFTFENRKKESVDWAAGIRGNYNVQRYKVNDEFNNSFFNYSLFLDADIYLNKTLTLTSSFDLRSYSGEGFSAAQQFKLWNVSIHQSFAEGKYSIGIEAFDLLKQNVGLRRYGGANTLNEANFNTLTQYFMLKASMKLGKKKKQSGISFG